MKLLSISTEQENKEAQEHFITLTDEEMEQVVGNGGWGYGCYPIIPCYPITPCYPIITPCVIPFLPCIGYGY